MKRSESAPVERASVPPQTKRRSWCRRERTYWYVGNASALRKQPEAWTTLARGVSSWAGIRQTTPFFLFFVSTAAVNSAYTSSATERCVVAAALSGVLRTVSECRNAPKERVIPSTESAIQSSRKLVLAKRDRGHGTHSTADSTRNGARGWSPKRGLDSTQVPRTLSSASLGLKT